MPISGETEMKMREITPWARTYYKIGRIFYTFNGLLGAQLTSYEWFKPEIREKRVLKLGMFGEKEIEVTIFSAKREGLKVRCLWALPSNCSHDEHLARINELGSALRGI